MNAIYLLQEHLIKDIILIINDYLMRSEYEIKINFLIRILPKLNTNNIITPLKFWYNREPKLSFPPKLFLTFRPTLQLFE